MAAQAMKTQAGAKQPISAQVVTGPSIRPSLEERLEEALPLKEQLDRVRGWRERVLPDLRRVVSAGRLLFQVVGVAGYAGYFVGMHTLMRVVSGTLMAGVWYAIYRVKGAPRRSAGAGKPVVVP